MRKVRSPARLLRDKSAPKGKQNHVAFFLELPQTSLLIARPVAVSPMTEKSDVVEEPMI